MTVFLVKSEVAEEDEDVAAEVCLQTNRKISDELTQKYLRYRNVLLKLCVVLPLLWLLVTLFLQSDDIKSEQNRNKVRDKHKPLAQARVDLLHNSNRLGEISQSSNGRPARS